MKRITRIFGFIMVCMMMFAFQVPTNAAEQKASVREVNQSQATVQGEKFTPRVYKLYYNFSNKEVTVYIKVRCNERDDNYGYDLQLLDYTKKKVLATKYVDHYGNWASFKIKRNQLYYYRIKAYGWNEEYDVVPVSNWLYGGGINTGICSVKLSGKKIKIKTPKIKGAKKLTLYMSTNIKKGYKKVKTVKPGSTVTLTKFNKKAFKEYENYFYYIVSSKKQSKFLQSFYIRTSRK